MLINFQKTPGTYTVTGVGLPNGGAGTITITPPLSFTPDQPGPLADNSVVQITKKGRRIFYFGHSHDVAVTVPANVKKNGSHSVPAEPLFGRMGRQARSEQVALRTIASCETDQVQLLHGFYTLSGYAQPDIVRENDDGFN